MKKRQVVLTDEIDQKVMKLFSLGMSYKDISANISEIYDVGVDKSQISGITDRIMRKFIKTKGGFTSGMALQKMIYCGIQSASKK